MFETVENWALHAYADGELEGEERKAMEKMLKENEEARKSYAAINFQKAELRNAFGDAVDELPPDYLLVVAQGNRNRHLLVYAKMAAALALVFLGAMGGWYAAHEAGSLQAADLAQRAFVAHEVFSVEVKHPFEVGASEQDNLQKWLSKRVGTHIQIPNLNEQGFTLLGGRLLAGENSPAGQLMYETVDKQRLTVFVGTNPDHKDEALRLIKNGKLITCYWRDGKLAVAVTGDLAKDDMMTVAQDVYDQMEEKG